MHTLLALILTAAAAVVIARPPGPVATTASHEESGLHTPTRKYLKDFVLPRYLWPHYFAFDETSLQPDQQSQRLPSMAATEWLSQEIQRLNIMQQRTANPFNPEVPRRVLHNPSYTKRWPIPYDTRDYLQSYYVKQPWPARSLVAKQPVQQQTHEMNEVSKGISDSVNIPLNEEQKKKEFALTPSDVGYFEHTIKDNSSVDLTSEGLHEGGGQQTLRGGVSQPATGAELELEPRRQIRQNPNLSRTKTLIAENLDKLRIGLGHEETGPMDNSRKTNVLENAAPETAGTFYGVALLSAIGAAIVLAVFGFAIGWYTLSKRAKAAADVDYPAYGVTGPTVDTSGDRKLAHSAHMYHYQHQKQQIIAMERNGMEQRSGSVTDPESEEENEEGDYTVYECPGLATTGEMEVKNPLFNEEPTPATPGKCEVVKPQPKD